MTHGEVQMIVDSLWWVIWSLWMLAAVILIRGGK